MSESSYRMSPYTFSRPGLEPREVAGKVEVRVTGEVSSGQPFRYLDAAVAFLHGALGALDQEIPLCPQSSERWSEITNMYSKVRDIQRAIEALPPM